MRTEQIVCLIQEALDARANAYAPYSGYTVGAALLTKDGRIYRGCNIENASYGATNCAERTAFFKALSEGNRSFAAIAIAGGKTGQAPVDYAYPCGICRQVMAEFCDADFAVIIAKSETDYRRFSMEEILPNAFSKDAVGSS